MTFQSPFHIIQENLEYAAACLSGARYYEFSKAYAMYEDIKSKILLVDQSLNFTLEELKELWIEASST